MRPSAGLFLGAAAIAATAAAGWALWPPSSPGRADPEDARQVALGEAVYRQHCASCHGVNLEGQPNWQIRKPDGRLPAPPHDEAGHSWHHPDEQLFRITKLGLKPPLAPEGYQSDMPAFGPTLSDDEIWAALAYIKSRWPIDIRARQSRLNQRASQ
ncbi:MAG: c-type cytochrome [Kiloniellales bacterium]